MKKIIEINSEKLKNFPEKITIAGEEFVYQEFEIMGSKIYGYLNEKEDGYLNQKEEDKMIIFIPTILGGSFQQNHLFLCHKFTHEYGKEMLLKKFIFQVNDNNFIYPPQSEGEENNYLISLERKTVNYFMTSQQLLTNRNVKIHRN